MEHSKSSLELAREVVDKHSGVNDCNEWFCDQDKMIEAIAQALDAERKRRPFSDEELAEIAHKLERAKRLEEACEYLLERVIPEVRDWHTNYTIINGTYIQDPVIKIRETLADYRGAEK